MITGGETMVVQVKSTGGMIIKEITVEVGKVLDIKIDEDEFIALDGCKAVHGPARAQFENRGEDGLHMVVQKGK